MAAPPDDTNNLGPGTSISNFLSQPLIAQLFGSTLPIPVAYAIPAFRQRYNVPEEPPKCVCAPSDDAGVVKAAIDGLMAAYAEMEGTGQRKIEVRLAFERGADVNISVGMRENGKHVLEEERSTEATEGATGAKESEIRARS